MGSRHLSLVLLLLLLTISVPDALLAAQITLDADDQYGFARQAMERGEYLRAVGEFERFIHFFPADGRVPQARFLIGLCYLRAKAYEAARKALVEVYRAYPERPVGARALFLLGESYYRQGQVLEAGRIFEKVIEHYPHLELENMARYRLGWNAMQRDRWQEASEAFRMVEQSSPLYAPAQDLAERSRRGEALPYKDPTTAGILGAVPGLGHVYSHRYKDGLVAFLLNGVTIAAAIEAFDEDLEVLGGILAFLELGWYSGSIYSAINSAHKHNRKVRNDFVRGLPDELDLELFTTNQGLGLSLRLHF